MGGEECIIIIQGNIVQGQSAMLATTAAASCQLVDYLRTEENWNEEDAKPIADFHLRATRKLKELNEELDRLNHELAHKYE
jgi:hypothetical protein